MRRWLGLFVVTGLGLALPIAAADDPPDYPDRSYTPDQVFTQITGDMGAEDHNQPSVVGGYLLLAGNGSHAFWDITDPVSPVLVSEFDSPHGDGEAESHQVAYHRAVDGTVGVMLINGRGVEFWDVTDPTTPALLGVALLEGVDYGDNSEAVWGVAWQGDYAYAGGTNTGLHVIDVSDPTAPTVVRRVPTAELGTVSAGPVFPIGNLMVMGVPKEHAGIVTIDIGDPADPTLLDFEKPETESYIGWFYGRHAYLLTPFRTYDVTTDPTDIRLLGSIETPNSEYVSFGDGHLFLGSLRPNPGIFKYRLIDGTAMEMLGQVRGRMRLGALLSDDQFSLPVGNLVIMSDDESAIGSSIGVHDERRDSRPPEVAYVNPADGATGQPLTTRVGLSFTDQIDLRSIDASSLIVRPVGGEPLEGSIAHMQTLVGFAPTEPLSPDTTYEVVLPAGGVTDLVGNAIAVEHRSAFSTGDGVAAPTCALEALAPAVVGEEATLSGVDAGPDALYAFDFGDGATAPPSAMASVSHAWDAPGRYPVVLEVETAAGTRRCSGTQIVHRPLTSDAPSRSSSVVVDEATTTAWMANPDADTVTGVDADSLEVRSETDVCARPQTLSRAGDGTIWVACEDGDEVAVLDADGGFLTAIALRYGAAPYGVVVSPDGETAWVSLQGTGELVAIDVASRAIRDRVPLSDEPMGAFVPRGVAVSHDGARVYVTRFISPADQGEVVVVDTAALEVERVITLAIDPGPDESTSGRGVPNYLSSIAISPDGTRAHVPSKKDNVERGLARDGEPLDNDNTVRTIVSVLDLEGGAELLDARVDLDDHDMAFAAEFSALGDVVFVASQGTNRVDVFDVATGEPIAGFSTGLAPQGLWLSGDRLYVASFLSRTLDVFDVSGILDATDNTARALAAVPTVAEEPLTPEVLLGKQIFYNADSPQMSRDGYLACASCHLGGGSDARVWDFTDRGEGLRNTTDLRGRAGVAHGPVHWTGNFDEIHDFENDIRNAFGGSGFLADEDWEAEMRSDPLGGAKAGLSPALDALAAYVATLDRFPRSPYKTEEGEMTAEALEGRAIFESLDCLECHAGERLTDSALDVRHEVGTVRDTSGSRLGEALDGFDTPTLRGVWNGAPYLHDGSAATLEEALRVPGHGNAQDLDAERMAALVRFLLELDDDALGYAEPDPDPDPEPMPMRELGGGGCACRSSGPGSAGTGWALLSLVPLIVLGRRRGQRRRFTGRWP